MRPKRIEITTGPAKRKNGQRDTWSRCPNPLDSSAGSVNGQPASNEKRT